MLDKLKQQEFLGRLIKFLKIKSISGNSKYKSEILQAVKFLKAELLEAGFSRTKIEELYARGLSNGGNSPVVYAERLNSPEAPTVLIYGHYDVQPPEPLEEWITPPFEPAIRDGKIFARGASDDKGQVYAHIAALKILKSEWGGKWPVNIKVLIEGEEESGGENIEKLVSDNPKKFKADLCLISDSNFLEGGISTIEVGLRGILYYEIEIVTAEQDLHSGLYGGAALNPFNVLSEAFVKLLRSFGEVKLRKVPENALGMSFDIHGFTGGFQGEGAKTVIPNKASAKFSIRLKPNQSSQEVAKSVSNFIKKNVPKGAKVNLNLLSGAQGFMANKNSKYIKLAGNCLKKVFGKKPVLSVSGGSIPIVSTLSQKTGAEIVMMGYGLSDDNLHSPNEKFDLEQFYKGIECNLEFLRNLVIHS